MRDSQMNIFGQKRSYRAGWAALGLLALLLAGCHSGKNQAKQPVERGAAVLVDNQDFSDMNVYIVRSGQRYRLGMVPGFGKRLFPIKPDFLTASTLSFQADPVGGRAAPVSQEIDVRPGEEVVLTIVRFR